MIEEQKNQFYKHLKNAFGDKGWEIKEMSPKDMNNVPTGLGLLVLKMTGIARELKKGALFPPIIISDEGKMIDGMHRFVTHVILGTEKIAVAKLLEGEKRTDTYYPKLKRCDPDKYYQLEKGRCISCLRTMERNENMFNCNVCETWYNHKGEYDVRPILKK